jgi:hypothetical protein
MQYGYYCPQATGMLRQADKHDSGKRTCAVGTRIFR